MRCQVELTADAHAAIVRDVVERVLGAFAAHRFDGRLAYSVGELSRATGVSMRELRREEERGALVVVRAGGHLPLVPAEFARLWLYGKATPTDDAQFGFDPKRRDQMRNVRDGKKTREPGSPASTARPSPEESRHEV